MERADEGILAARSSMELLQTKMRGEKYGNELFSKQLVALDKEIFLAAEGRNWLRLYRILTRRYRPTKLGFRADLIRGIQERLDFLTVHAGRQCIGGKKLVPHDWLGAIADGVKSLPGGGVLLGPLLKLRDDEKKEQRNRQIDELFEQNRQLTDQVLNAVLKLPTANDITALLWISSHIGNQLFAERRGNEVPVPDRLHLSRFPFPFPPGLLMEELESLRLEKSEIRFAVRKANLPDLYDEGPIQDLISRFVDSMNGAERGKLRQLFSDLYNKHGASKILQFCSEYLADKAVSAGSSTA